MQLQNFESQAMVIPPPSNNPQPQEHVPMISQVMAPQEQALRAEEFRGFVRQLYTNNQSYINGVLNYLVAPENQMYYQEARRNYLMFCATAKMNFQQVYGRDGNAHLLLAKLAIYRVPVISQFFSNNQNSNDVNLRNWIAGESQLNNNQFVSTIKTLTQQSIDKRNAGRGMDFNSGMTSDAGGMVDPGGTMGNLQPTNMGGMANLNNNQPTNAPMFPNTQQVQGNVHNSMTGFDNVSNTTNLNMNMGTQQVDPNNLNPNAAQMSSVSQPQNNQPSQAQRDEVRIASERRKAQAQADKVKAVRREGHRLFLNTRNPNLYDLVIAQIGVKGGWAINPKDSLFDEEEFTTFDSFKWVTKYGVVTDRTLIKPSTYLDMQNAEEELEHLDRQELEHLYMDYAGLDEEDPTSEGYFEYLKLLESQAERKRGRYYDLDNGLFLGVNDVCTTQTKPWLRVSSAETSLTRIFDEATLSLLEDTLHVSVINGREYFLLDSSDVFTNNLVKAKRDQYKEAWQRVDNQSAKGHYYLINHHLEDLDGSPIIEDFYDLEEYDVDPDKYKVDDAPTFMMDSDTPGELVEVSAPKRTRLHETEVTLVNASSVELANSIREDLAINRVGDWHLSILKGKTKKLTSFLSASKKDREFFKKFQNTLVNSEVLTLRALGDYLDKAKEDKTLTKRMEIILDGRIMKELNILFNDLLGFDGLMIEHSFIEEYNELINLLLDEETPKLVRATFKYVEAYFLQNLLLEEDLTKTRNQYILNDYKARTHYKVEDVDGVDHVVVNDELQLSLSQDLHTWLDTTVVYVIPQSVISLGINPHNNVLSVPWDTLPQSLLEILRKHFGKDYPMEKVQIVTKDNYVLNVNATRNENLVGTLSLAV